MLKNILFGVLGVVIGVVVVGGVWFVMARDYDCDDAVRIVEERIGQFQQKEGEVGACDGICVERSFAGCTVSDDFNSWLVTPWGRVFGPNLDSATDGETAWKSVTIGGIVTFEIPVECTLDPGAGNAYLICPTDENPTPTPEMKFSSDGITVNVRRWEGLETPYWDHIIESMNVVTPMERDITITIEK